MLPHLSIADVNTGRGPKGTSRTVTLTVSLDAPAEEPVTFHLKDRGVELAGQGHGYAERNTDYDPIDGNFTIPKGETKVEIPVTVHGADPGPTKTAQFFAEPTKIVGATPLRTIGTILLNAGDAPQTSTPVR